MNPWASRLKFGIPFKVLQRERRTRLNAGSDWGINSCWCGWASSCRSSPTYILRSSPLSEPYLSHNVQTHMLQLSWCDHMPEECNSSRFFSLSLSLWPHLYRSVLALTSASAPVNLLLSSFTDARCSPLSPFSSSTLSPLLSPYGHRLEANWAKRKQKLSRNKPTARG